MPNNLPTSLGDTLANESAMLADKLSIGAKQLHDSTSELGRKAAGRIDGSLGSAASALEQAAAKLHKTADNLPGVDKAIGLTHATADKLTATAGFVREHDVDSMVSDVRRLVRRNPGPTLLVVGVIGFLMGRAFSRRNLA